MVSAELSELAKRAAEAHTASGDAPSAIALYRRALSFEPQSSELLSRIDDLLRDQGSPRERIALYRAVLARGDTSRKKELVHRIGAIEWHDLGDIDAATATYRAALDDDPEDVDAYAALSDLYACAERWADVCALLEVRLARVEGAAARALRARLAEIAASHGDEERARVQCARLLEDAELTPEHLDAVGAAADRLHDTDLARAVLRRRAEMAQEPREQIAWLEKLGELDEAAPGTFESAAAAWKRAAALAESMEDDEAARRLYGRARRAAPSDREVTGHLVTLCERAELWSELPGLFTALSELETDDAVRSDLALKTASVLSDRLGDHRGAAEQAARALEFAPARADVLATFERLSVTASTLDRFEQTIDGVLARMDPNRRAEGDAQALLFLARARALGADPARSDDASRAYRAILDEPRFDRAHHVSALVALEAHIARDPEPPRRLPDRRWVLEWRAEHAPEEERVLRLLEWAHDEEKTFGDPATGSRAAQARARDRRRLRRRAVFGRPPRARDGRHRGGAVRAARPARARRRTVADRDRPRDRGRAARANDALERGARRPPRGARGRPHRARRRARSRPSFSRTARRARRPSSSSSRRARQRTTRGRARTS